MALDQRAEVCVDVAVVDMHGLAERDARDFWKEFVAALDGRWFGAWRERLCAIEVHACGTFIQIEGTASSRDL